MTNSVVGIWNAALADIRAGGLVSTTNENTVPAEKCRLYYDLVRTTMLEAAPWSIARKTSYLQLLATRNFNQAWDADDPSPEYKYVYGLPAGMLRPIHLTTYQPFVLEQCNDVMSLHTNMENAALTYVVDVTEVQRWTPGMRQTAVAGLAGYLAAAIAGKPALQAQKFAEANAFIRQARDAMSQHYQHPEEHIPDWIMARGFLPPQFQQTRYTYPWGQMFAEGLVSGN